VSVFFYAESSTEELLESEELESESSRIGNGGVVVANGVGGMVVVSSAVWGNGVVVLVVG
jgi:hypothetical protein